MSYARVERTFSTEPPSRFAPAQAELVLDAPERCRRCGRLWPGLLFGAFVDLEALMKRAPDERGEFARCWTGTCGGPK